MHGFSSAEVVPGVLPVPVVAAAIKLNGEMPQLNTPAATAAADVSMRLMAAGKLDWQTLHHPVVTDEQIGNFSRAIAVFHGQYGIPHMPTEAMSAHASAGVEVGRPAGVIHEITPERLDGLVRTAGMAVVHASGVYFDAAEHYRNSSGLRRACASIIENMWPLGFFGREVWGVDPRSSLEIALDAGQEVDIPAPAFQMLSRLWAVGAATLSQPDIKEAGRAYRQALGDTYQRRLGALRRDLLTFRFARMLRKNITAAVDANRPQLEQETGLRLPKQVVSRFLHSLEES